MLKDKYRLTQEVAKMMEYIDEHPVSLMVLEAFGKVHYPQDKNLGMEFSVTVTAWTLMQELHAI